MSCKVQGFVLQEKQGLQVKLAAFEVSNATLTSSLEASQAQRAVNQEANTSAQQKCKELQAELATLKGTNASLSRSFETSQSELSTSQETVSRAQQRSEDLQAKLDKLTQESELVQKSLDASKANHERTQKVKPCLNLYETHCTTGCHAGCATQFWRTTIYLLLDVKKACWNSCVKCCCIRHHKWECHTCTEC